MKQEEEWGRSVECKHGASRSTVQAEAWFKQNHGPRRSSAQADAWTSSMAQKHGAETWSTSMEQKHGAGDGAESWSRGVEQKEEWSRIM
jgi:hypothetical protein